MWTRIIFFGEIEWYVFEHMNMSDHYVVLLNISFQKAIMKILIFLYFKEMI